jgi:hypothetical protein
MKTRDCTPRWIEWSCHPRAEAKGEPDIGARQAFVARRLNRCSVLEDECHLQMDTELGDQTLFIH